MAYLNPFSAISPQFPIAETELAGRQTILAQQRTNYNGLAVIAGTQSTPRYLEVGGYLRF